MLLKCMKSRGKGSFLPSLVLASGLRDGHRPGDRNEGTVLIGQKHLHHSAAFSQEPARYPALLTKLLESRYLGAALEKKVEGQAGDSKEAAGRCGTRENKSGSQSQHSSPDASLLKRD